MQMLASQARTTGEMRLCPDGAENEGGEKQVTHGAYTDRQRKS